MDPTEDYQERLESARAFVAELHTRFTDMPPHIVDQAIAAGMDGNARLLRVGRSRNLPLVQPALSYDEANARLMAAMTDDWKTCRHLEQTPIQVGYIFLAHRWSVCQQCLSSLLAFLPPEDEADRCDLCGRRGVSIFWPFHLQLGYGIAIGSVCEPCASDFGLKEAAS